MRWKLAHHKKLGALTAAALAVISVVLVNVFAVNLPISIKLGEDLRNERISVFSYYRFLVDPTTLMVDLWNTDDVTPADLTRVLFQVSEYSQDYPYGRVILSRKGRARFVVDGSSFRGIWEELLRETDSSVIRSTLLESMQRPRGDAVYRHGVGELEHDIEAENVRFANVMIEWAR